MNRNEISAVEILQLFCLWEQLGDKWCVIATLMGRPETWVKRNWISLLEKEKVSEEELRAEPSSVLEKLKILAVNEQPTMDIMKSTNEIQDDEKFESDMQEEFKSKDNKERMININTKKTTKLTISKVTIGNFDEYGTIAGPKINLPTKSNFNENKQYRSKVVNTELEEFDFSVNTEEGCIGLNMKDSAKKRNIKSKFLSQKNIL